MSNCSQVLTVACQGASFTYESGLYQCAPFNFKPYGEIELGFAARAYSFELLASLQEWSDINAVFESYISNYQQAPVFIFDDGEGEFFTIKEGITDSKYEVAVSFEAGNQSAESPCLFVEPPSATNVGNYFNVKFSFVVAEDYFACVTRKKYFDYVSSAQYVGQYSLWGVDLNLKQIKESYQDMPALQRTATGISYVEGPQKVMTVFNIVGDTNKSGWLQIYEKTKQIAEATPDGSEPFPLSVPTCEVTQGLNANDESIADIYTVTISVGLPILS